jgi:hypothetical protein
MLLQAHAALTFCIEIAFQALFVQRELPARLWYPMYSQVYYVSGIVQAGSKREESFIASAQAH